MMGLLWQAVWLAAAVPFCWRRFVQICWEGFVEYSVFLELP